MDKNRRQSFEKNKKNSKGGKKGKKGGPRLNDDDREDFSLYDTQAGNGNSRPRNAGNRSRQNHPPWLKGKEIGLHYASRQKQKQSPKKERLKSFHPCSSLRRGQQIVIQGFLQSYTLNGTSGLLQSSADWQVKYEQLGNSKFKTQFLGTLDANEQCDFGNSAGASCPVFSTNLEQDAAVDLFLFESLNSRQTDEEFLKMHDTRSQLPVYQMKELITEEIKNNPVTVICGETGCGKTTQIAQFLLDEAILNKEGSRFRAICTQPRRIAAISVAQRVADERRETCGGSESSVGFQIRLEAKIPRMQGSILFCTTGILLQFLQSDPLLQNISHLLIDEVHERDILSDFLITVVKDLLPRRPDLRVVLMSATIDAETFSRYFDNCPVIHIPGFTFPVEDLYLEDVLAATNFRVHSRYSPKALKRRPPMKEDIEYTEMIVPYVEQLEQDRAYPRHVMVSLRMRESEEASEDLILALLRFICNEKGPGAVLVFLPGWEQISRVHHLLSGDRYFSGRNYLILPLHSMMPTVNQKAVFDRPPRGVRKIVLSTNIAETSLTIDDVVYVVDCGKAKQSSYDSKRNIDTLKPEWISQANAKQRRGRAGRVQSGVCYRLYSRARQEAFLAHPIPEIQRTRLEEVILQLKILKLGKAESFMRQVLEPPDPRQVTASLNLLRGLGALDEAEHLTPMGFHLARLPTDPRTGKLLIMAAIFGCLEPVAAIAATLSFKDPFVTPLHKVEQVRQTKQKLSGGTHSDHLLFARVLSEYEKHKRNGWASVNEFCYRHFLSGNTMSMLYDMMHQFARELHENRFIATPSPKDPEANRNSKNDELIRAVLCSALLPNVAQVISSAPKRKGKGVTIQGSVAKILTMSDGRVYIHPRSVNFGERNLNSHWLVYHQKVKTSQIFLHDCSEVSAFALLFFGKKLHISGKKRGKQVVSIDGGVTITCDSATVDLISRLRQRFDEMLSYRVSHPGCTDWSPQSKDGALLRVIINLLSSSSADEEEEDFVLEGIQPKGRRARHRQPEVSRGAVGLESDDEDEEDLFDNGELGDIDNFEGLDEEDSDSDVEEEEEEEEEDSSDEEDVDEDEDEEDYGSEEEEEVLYEEV